MGVAIEEWKTHESSSSTAALLEKINACKCSEACQSERKQSSAGRLRFRLHGKLSQLTIV